MTKVWCMLCNHNGKSYYKLKLDDTMSTNKLRHLAQAEGASTEILCSNKLRINFFWKGFPSFVVFCNAQESIPVTAATDQLVTRMGDLS